MNTTKDGAMSKEELARLIAASGYTQAKVAAMFVDPVKLVQAVLDAAGHGELLAVLGGEDMRWLLTQAVNGDISGDDPATLERLVGLRHAVYTAVKKAKGGGE